jgi:hypothetical protein
MEIIDEAGRPTGTLSPPADVSLPSGDLREVMLAFPFDVLCMATSGNAFASWALRRIFPVPEVEFRNNADSYVVKLASLLGTTVSLDEAGAYRRVHGGNSFLSAGPSIDLAKLRSGIACTERTRYYLQVLACELGLAHDKTAINAFSDVANRLISLRLEPKSHAILSDRRFNLICAGARAAIGRFDLALRMRLLFVLWLAAEASAPRVVARQLAELFLFQERRGWLNGVLAHLRLQDSDRRRPSAPRRLPSVD